jgi:hypothetical protein
MMKLPAFVSVFSLTFFAALASSSAFIARELSSSRSMRTIGFEKIPVVLQATAQDTNGLTPQEINVYELLKELSDSKLPFRIVVVGNGAILESTNTLGPTFKLGKSPKSGASIVTFASEDQSFEFHLMPAQIASAVLVEKPSPTKVDLLPDPGGRFEPGRELVPINGRQARIGSRVLSKLQRCLL